jgi:hypothetical protein
VPRAATDAVTSEAVIWLQEENGCTYRESATGDITAFFVAELKKGEAATSLRTWLRSILISRLVRFLRQPRQA